MADSIWSRARKLIKKAPATGVRAVDSKRATKQTQTTKTRKDTEESRDSGSSSLVGPCLRRNPGVAAIEEALRERYGLRQVRSNRDSRSKVSGFPTQEDLGIGKLTGKLKVDTPVELLRHGYRYISQVDEGSFGKIYKAINLRTNAVVAIKHIDRTKEEIRNWIDSGCLDHEMKIMLAVKHPNLLGALDAIKFRSSAFIVMPYVDGGNVRSCMQREGRPFPERQARRWFYDMALGMHYLHENQIVHRDLKPENLMVDTEFDRLMIADFGFAKLHPATPSTTNCKTSTSLPPYAAPATRKPGQALPCQSACGTVEYSAPEINQIRLWALEPASVAHDCKYDGKAADVYSMGACLFEMLYLFKAFVNPEEIIITDQAELLRLVHPRQVAERFTPNRLVKLSESCTKLLHWTMKADPDRRPTVAQILNCEWVSSLVQAEQRKRNKLKQIMQLIDEYMAIDAE